MFEKKVTVTEKKAAEKAVRKNDKKQKGKESKAIVIKSILIPLVLAAIAVCVIYLVMDNQTKNEIVKAPAVCAMKNITANTYISEKEVDQYFEAKDVEAAILPESIYSSIKELPDGGFYVEQDMKAKEMLYEKDICETDEVMDKYVPGTNLTAIKVNDFNNSVSGTLRHGDIVDVYAIDPATEQLSLLVEGVYVESAFDNSGNELTPEYEAENGVGTAVVFSVKVAPSETEQMNKAIAYGGIQLYLTGK